MKIQLFFDSNATKDDPTGLLIAIGMIVNGKKYWRTFSNPIERLRDIRFRWALRKDAALTRKRCS